MKLASLMPLSGVTYEKKLNLKNKPFFKKLKSIFWGAPLKLMFITEHYNMTESHYVGRGFCAARYKVVGKTTIFVWVEGEGQFWVKSALLILAIAS